MFFITGDTHGSYRRLRAFFRHKHVTPTDTLIILGDTGLNYYDDDRDLPHKNSAARLPLTLLCLRGNHDRQPETLPRCIPVTRFGGTVYLEEARPNILFAKDGELYRMEEKTVIAIGGAYSVDKEWRLMHGYNWFPDEQISPQGLLEIEKKLDVLHWQVDIVLTHTCPLRFVPEEALFASIDQRMVDKSMERWLDTVEQRLTYKQWLCGHFHIDKKNGPIRFLFRDVIPL